MDPQNSQSRSRRSLPDPRTIYGGMTRSIPSNLSTIRNLACNLPRRFCSVMTNPIINYPTPSSQRVTTPISPFTTHAARQTTTGERTAWRNMAGGIFLLPLFPPDSYTRKPVLPSPTCARPLLFFFFFFSKTIIVFPTAVSQAG